MLITVFFSFTNQSIVAITFPQRHCKVTIMRWHDKKKSIKKQRFRKKSLFWVLFEKVFKILSDTFMEMNAFMSPHVVGLTWINEEINLSA